MFSTINLASYSDQKQLCFEKLEKSSLAKNQLWCLGSQDGGKTLCGYGATCLLVLPYTDGGIVLFVNGVGVSV